LAPPKAALHMMHWPCIYGLAGLASIQLKADELEIRPPDGPS